MSKGILMVVSGPSGAGKSTVVQELVAQTEGTYLSISVTTRSPRPFEKQGEHYYFVSESEFRSMIEGGELLEYAEYAGNFYGTPAVEVDKMLSEGKDVILEIDIQGGLQVKERRPNVVLAFLIPPTVEELESRLRLRGSESEMTIRKRLEIAEREYKNVSQYDYVVVNDNVEDAVARLQAILVAERCSAKRVNPKDIKKVLAQEDW